ncbi:dolichyl-P-Glc:Glc1Man9GlcNAc2-PP-dolichol alpha-1,3-glucosyltransferase [Malassezia psittaci]|uniref:Dolichyl-P-Glc:Glc1Man9GlcNAc2-PP-dolichol alpha-1,3-glucosyltransferase n=1 Tax=Malassezia psittaci TaxID=1821823 RepID=A0AAF0F838_9BASI|nr:dolichyl-P-Glc:Glc1Man9GlcNAc2-PP-dolichol alpha-1,3-glucosyltransferase [Malassezia psittaci]
MPFVKRKPVNPLPVPSALVDAQSQGKNPTVFYLATTGEVFEDYEKYISRLSYYHQRIFQSEPSGKPNLTFFEAAETEAQQALAIQKRFPDALKAPVLRAVQFHVTGRVDNLVEQVAERFKERFFTGETVHVDIEGQRTLAIIKRVSGPHIKTEDSSNERESHSEHAIGSRLSVPIEEATRLDNHADYRYDVQRIDDKGQNLDDVYRVEFTQLSRDRTTFSKSILRKYLKDCVERDSQVGSPWMVREPLAKRFHISTEMSDEMAQRIDDMKAGKLSKRRKLTDGDTSQASPRRKARDEKKQRKQEAAEANVKPEKKVPLKFPAEDLLLDVITDKELATETPGELSKRAQRPELDPSSMLGVPGELFDSFMAVYYFFLTLGKPLGISTIAWDDFEGALRHMTYEPPCELLSEIHAVLLNAIVRDGSHSRDLAPGVIEAKKRQASQALQALQAAQAASATHTAQAMDIDNANETTEADPENGPRSMHGSISNPSSAPDTPRLMQDDDHDSGNESSDISEPEDWDESPEKSVMDAALSLGRGWDKRILHADDHRAGWEKHLVGCIANRATPEALPRMYAVLSLLTGEEHADAVQDGKFVADTYRTPAERYVHLSMADKLEILLFLCQQAVVTRQVKTYYEECEAHLTELRKERVELIRMRKRALEQRQELDGQKSAENTENATPIEEEDPPPAVALQSDPPLSQESDSDSERDELASESESESEQSESENSAESDANSERFKRVLGSRQEALREKAIQRDAEQARIAAEIAKNKEHQRETKQLNAERRRAEEEEVRLLRREEAIEREFRRYAMIPRLRPLGRDRFGNKYFWLDGIGAASLSGSGGGVLYQTGRVFVQSASKQEWDDLCVKYHEGASALLERRAKELQSSDPIAYGEWAVYTKPEQVEELIAWLRTKGIRENALKAQLLKYRDYIEAGMRRRNDDIALGWREPAIETRRSSRTRIEQSAQMRLPYMTWRNTYSK